MKKIVALIILTFTLVVLGGCNSETIEETPSKDTAFYNTVTVTEKEISKEKGRKGEKEREKWSHEILDHQRYKENSKIFYI